MSLTAAFLQSALWTKCGCDGRVVAVPPEGRGYRAAVAPCRRSAELALVPVRGGASRARAGPLLPPGLISWADFEIGGVLPFTCILR